MNFTNNWTLAKLTASAKAKALKVENLQNNPPADVVERLQILSNEVLQVISDEAARRYPGSEVFTTSGYRCLPVNRAVGSADDSQHPKGEASDTKLRYNGAIRNDLLVQIIKDLFAPGKRPFDQIILEYGASGLNPQWVHISYTKRRGNRRSVLRKVEGKPYTNFKLW